MLKENFLPLDLPMICLATQSLCMKASINMTVKTKDPIGQENISKIQMQLMRKIFTTTDLTPVISKIHKNSQ